MQVIPAIDLMDGNCVRLTRGDPTTRKTYFDNPLEPALKFENQGARLIHLVDLDAAFGLGDNINVVKRLASGLKARLQVGGGIRDLDRAESLLNAGVARVVFGTKAISQPELVQEAIRQFGRDAVCVSLDARGESPSLDGWRRRITADLYETASRLDQLGASSLIFTDIERDGMLKGVNSQAIESLLRNLRTPLIASGGVSSLQDIQKLRALGVKGVIVGKALYEGRIEFSEALRLTYAD